jgi:hypothetical protein
MRRRLRCYLPLYLAHSFLRLSCPSDTGRYRSTAANPRKRLHHLASGLSLGVGEIVRPGRPNRRCDRMCALAAMPGWTELTRILSLPCCTATHLVISRTAAFKAL